MTMGWHTVMEFTPSLVGCIIAEGSHSFDLVRRSSECVINLPQRRSPTQRSASAIARRDVDKFEKFQLTAEPAQKSRRR